MSKVFIALAHGAISLFISVVPGRFDYGHDFTERLLGFSLLCPCAQARVSYGCEQARRALALTDSPSASACAIRTRSTTIWFEPLGA
jgi:hypothetical protein